MTTNGPNPKILLTGMPGSGKTTTVMKIVEKLENAKIAGFYTQEIRQGGNRKGFRWSRFDGTEGTLAHVDIKGPHRVGKYGVDVAEFERSVVPVVDVERIDAELFVIDEIGKMECLSKQFEDAVRRLFASDKPFLATVARKGPGLIREIKQYPGIRLFSLTRDHSAATIDEILQVLSFVKRT